MSISEALEKAGFAQHGFTPKVLACTHCPWDDIDLSKIIEERVKKQTYGYYGTISTAYEIERRAVSGEDVTKWMAKHADCAAKAEAESRAGWRD